MAVAEVFLQSVDTIIFILKWFWWAIILLILFIMKARWKNWVMDVVIIEKRGDNLIRTNDRAKKTIDSAGIVKYELMKSKDTVPVVNYDWILHNNNVHTNILERMVNLLRPTVGTLFFFRYGSKQYKPIKIRTKNGDKVEWRESKDLNGQPIIYQIYQQVDPRDKLKSLDFEVVDWDNMNFMVQEQRSSIDRRRNNREKWMQLIIPLAIIIGAIMVGIFILYFSYKSGADLRSVTGVQPDPPKATQPNIPGVSNLIPGA